MALFTPEWREIYLDSLTIQEQQLEGKRIILQFKYMLGKGKNEFELTKHLQSENVKIILSIRLKKIGTAFKNICIKLSDFEGLNRFESDVVMLYLQEDTRIFYHKSAVGLFILLLFLDFFLFYKSVSGKLKNAVKLTI